MSAARRSLWVIIVGLFMIAMGTYLVTPFFTIYLRETIGLSALEVGMALTAKLWASYGLTMVGGALADRYGARTTMVVGLLIRAVSYMGIASAGSAPSVIAWSILMGMGGALFNPASKTAMAALATNQDRVKLFSMRNTANNVGVSIGPMLGLAALFGSPRTVFFIAALTYIIFALLTLFLVGPLPGERAHAARPFHWRIVTWLAFDIRMLYLEGIIAVFMFLYVQMEITMPLYAKTQFGGWAVSALFTVNAITVVILQVPLSTFLSKRYPASTSVALGLVGMALGLLLTGLSNSVTLFLVAVFIFTMGEVIIDPRVDAETSDMVPPGTVGTALGILGAMNALGGTLGNMVGGPVYSRMAEAGAMQSYWTWLGFGAIIAAVAVMVVGSLLEVPVEEEGD
ncbi:MAG TPA: MFS transporter [Symbiobacteriaceae bacterium]|nr:MFS transporter [Symbiobacteriaceae bacterium]